MNNLRKIIICALSALLTLILSSSVFAYGETDGKIYFVCDASCVDGGEHSWREASRSEPTCGEEGTVRYICDLCGEEKTEHEQALGHDFRILYVVSEPTCLDKGSEMIRCSRCGLETDRDIEAAGHTGRSTSRVDATCTEDGIEYFVCSVCGEEYTKSITKLQHKYELEESFAGSCTEDAYDKYICSVCGKEHIDIRKNASHSFRETYRSDATCAAGGRTDYVCTVCGEKSSVTEPPLGHDWDNGELTEKAGFFSNGTITYKCYRNSEHTKNVSVPSEISSVKETAAFTKLFSASLIIAAAFTAVRWFLSSGKAKKAEKESNDFGFNGSVDK